MKKKLFLFMMVCALCLFPLTSFAATSDDAVTEDLARQEIIDEKPVYAVDANGMVTSDIIKNSTTRAAAKTTGKYPTTKGVILYTKDTVTRIAKVVGHAAIVYSSKQVVEATSSGVKRGNNNWNKKKHCRAGMIPVLSKKAMSKVANKCNSWLGKPYNYYFTNTKTRAKFYCSQLVWAGYKDSAGYNLNSGNVIVFPSELISSRSVAVIYKKG